MQKKKTKERKKESEDPLQKVKVKPTIVGDKSESSQALKFVPPPLKIITIFLSLLNWVGDLLIYNILYSNRKVQSGYSSEVVVAVWYKLTDGWYSETWSQLSQFTTLEAPTQLNCSESHQYRTLIWGSCSKS